MKVLKDPDNRITEQEKILPELRGFFNETEK
jgi:hypothetical protein